MSEAAAIGAGTASPSYRARTIKRTRRTRAQTEQLDRQIVDVLAADHPQSVRHVFYRMTDPRLPEPVEKSDRGYRHVQHRCVELRRARQVPFGWITDATRRGYFTPVYADAADFLRSMQGRYRADLWRDSDTYCEIWVESRSIAGIVQRDCEDLAVSLYPAGGFTSISLAYQAAEYINAEHDARDVVIFYIGDYDPAGVLIDVSIERELRDHLSPDVSLRFKRIGITPGQIAAYDLPSNPRKATDRRSRHITEAVEAEAMPARFMRHLLRNHIEALLPPRALEVARAAEESERTLIGGLAAAIERGELQP
jgi:hypothetical protein